MNFETLKQLKIPEGIVVSIAINGQNVWVADEQPASKGLAYALSDDGTHYIVTGKGTCTDTHIIIPTTYNNKLVKSIGEEAFYNCKGITSVTIPNSIESIGSLAFQGCSLTSVYITDIAKWCGINFDGYTANPLYYAHNLYLNNVFVTNLVIPDSVTSIGKYIFCNFTSLTSVTIGSGVTSIGTNAFSSCTSLTSIKYRGTESQWNAISKDYFWISNSGNYTITYNYTGD